MQDLYPTDPFSFCEKTHLTREGVSLLPHPPLSHPPPPWPLCSIKSHKTDFLYISFFFSGYILVKLGFRSLEKVSRSFSNKNSRKHERYKIHVSSSLLVIMSCSVSAFITSPSRPNLFIGNNCKWICVDLLLNSQN